MSQSTDSISKSHYVIQMALKHLYDNHRIVSYLVRSNLRDIEWQVHKATMDFKFLAYVYIGSET